MKAIAVPFVAAVISATVLSPLRESNILKAQSAASARSVQAADTATARIHISGMTCGTCPVTARKALGKLAGVYRATVTLPDSLGVIKFDPNKVKPAEIATHLTKMTGYGAKVLPDTVKAPPSGAKG